MVVRTEPQTFRSGQQIATPIVMDHHVRAHPLGGYTKRGFDLLFAVFALAAAAVIFVFVFVAMKIVDPGPVFFQHERIGFGGRKFKCLKFRSMCVDSPERLKAHLEANPSAALEWSATRKLKDDPRIIPVVGNFLRKTSLDELPQFVNVLRGDMSVVGPRPVTEEELKNYGEVRQEYVQTRPGITGLWQVSGRNDVTFAQRVEIDRTYVRTWKFGLDLKIIARTVNVVFRQAGAY